MKELIADIQKKIDMENAMLNAAPESAKACHHSAITAYEMCKLLARARAGLARNNEELKRFEELNKQS